MTVDPLLGAEIFQIYPGVSASVLCHRGHIGSRQLAGEGFYHHICRLNSHVGFCPLLNFHATGNLHRQERVNFRVNLLKTDQVVRPETNLEIMLGDQLTGEPPTDADIAVIINYGAEDVPAWQGVIRCRGFLLQVRFFR